MDVSSSQPVVKKAFLDKKAADQKARGLIAAPEMMHVRCPKCGTRWRMRGDQLR